MKKIAADIDILLKEYLGNQTDVLSEISRYSALDAGKRVRAYLTATIGEIFGADYNACLRAACAIELIHNFSLIHDDLPCIDNDKLRRGKPSVWAKFGESDAILAGDYLHDFAYKILANDEKIGDINLRMKLIQILSDKTRKIILGEQMDVAAETGIYNTESDIIKIQELKTGALFNACAEFGMVLGNATESDKINIKKWTDAFGLCFQITDDILDAVGDEKLVGKTLGKDGKKATYVSLLGLDGARARVDELIKISEDALSQIKGDTTKLSELMMFLKNRNS